MFGFGSGNEKSPLLAALSLLNIQPSKQQTNQKGRLHKKGNYRKFLLIYFVCWGIHTKHVSVLKSSEISDLPTDFCEIIYILLGEKNF